VSEYWLIIAPTAVAAMAGVVALSRHLAYRPQHKLTGPPPPPAESFTGSMSLADDPSVQRRPAAFGTWSPHADPWPRGWTDDDLAELHDAPTVFDRLEPLLDDAPTVFDRLEPLPPNDEEEAWHPSYIPDSGSQRYPSAEYVPLHDEYDPGPEADDEELGGEFGPDEDEGRPPWEPEPSDLADQLALLAAEVELYQRHQDTETGFYLAGLADQRHAYVTGLREHL
jgi:hypothetical protein